MLDRWRKLDPRNGLREQKEIAADFTLKSGKEFHQALTAPAKYDQELEKIVPLPDIRDLQEALEMYNATAEEALRFSVNTCTFDDVLSELKAAVRVYEQKATGPANVLRRFARAAGDYSVEIAPWCDLVPADNGLNVLSAGLRMIFSIAKRNADNRERILQAFHDIPALVNKASRQQSQFAFSKDVRHSAITFYETVVRALAQLIVQLNGSINSDTRFWDRVSRLRERLFGSSLRGKSIDTILRTVSIQVAKFEECLDLVRDKIRMGTYETVVVAAEAMHEFNEKLQQLQSDMKSLKENAEKSKDDGPDPILQRQVSTEAIELGQKYGSMNRKDQHSLDIMNHLFNFLISNYSGRPPKNHLPTQYPQHWLSETELMQSLGVYFRQHLEDLDTVLKEQHQFDDAAQSHARQLLQSPRFSHWFSSQSSDVLWVNGNCECVGPGRLSALSLLCALFVLSVHQNTNAIVLHHFCGLHEIGGEGAVTGPNGLIRSLIFQLLFCSRHKFNLDFICTQESADEILSQSLHTLCHTFRRLIEQLPKKQSVICIIDGITGFEYGPWLNDLWDVMDILDKIVKDPALRPHFKLLVTTPFADGVVDRTVMEHQRLVLPSDSSSGGFAEMSDRLVWDEIGQATRLEEYRRAVRLNEEEDSEDSDGLSE